MKRHKPFYEIRLLIILTQFFGLLPVSFCYAQSLTQIDLMDTTIVEAKTNNQSTLIIHSNDFDLYINKKYFIKVLRKELKGDRSSIIKYLKSTDTFSYEKFNFLTSKHTNENSDFLARQIIVKCIQNGEFYSVVDKFGKTYKIILKVTNTNLLSEELKAQNYSCKRLYLEFLLPDKKTSIVKQVSHITPREP